MAKKIWTPEERKAFGDKMAAKRAEKKASQAPSDNSGTSMPPLAPQAPIPASSEQSPEVAKRLAELDEVIRKGNELNTKLEAQAKEQSEAFKNGLKTMSVEEERQVIEVHKTDAQKMKDHLATQPKVQIFVPLEGKERRGQQLPVTINGYRVNIPKGMYVKVPEQIAQIVMDSLNQTEEAIHNAMEVDGNSEKEAALA